MELINCPSCGHTFSPSPGKPARCPSCMTVAKRSAKGRSKKSRDDEGEPSSALIWSVLGGAALVLILGGGIFAMTRSGGLKKTPDARAQAAKQPLKAAPGVVAAVDPEAPQGPGKENPPPTDTSNAKLPTEAENDKAFASLFPKKAQPVDPSVGPAIKDSIEPPKAGKQEVRDVPGVTPKKVNDAIRKGAQYLSKTSPSWFNNQGHRLGYIALGGLTLLECKVMHNEPLLVQAADWTRKLAPGETQTYDIAVAILFLDRIGEQRDKALIQTLGARLMAGQQSGGGFGYYCPILTPLETRELLAFAKRTKPRAAPVPLDAQMKLDGDGEGGTTIITADGPVTSQPPRIRPKNRLAANTGTIRIEKGTTISSAGLPEKLKLLPFVVNQGRSREQFVISLPDVFRADLYPGMKDNPTDQSNLQFAVLGMWAARRHDVVTDRSLLLADARIRQIQQPNGQIEYLRDVTIDNNGKTVIGYQHSDAMACAGILTMAVGHAIHQPDPASIVRAIGNDPQIERSMQVLRRTVSDPAVDPEKALDVSIFMLWSIERIAVLFNMSTIDNKDWYGSGAQSLLKFQEDDGSWKSGGTPSLSEHVNTCFALLFLTRSNLVRDISEYMILQRPIEKTK